jgi:hypothetical protein
MDSRTPGRAPSSRDSRAPSGSARAARAGGRTSDTPPPQVGVPANPGPSSVPWSFVFSLPLPSCQPASTSRGSLLTRGTTHRGPSPPRQPWASEPCLLAQPQPALPRVGSRPLPPGKPCASRGVDRPSKACAIGISLHHLCEPEGRGGWGCPESGHPVQNLDRLRPTNPAPRVGDPSEPLHALLLAHLLQAVQVKPLVPQA